MSCRRDIGRQRGGQVHRRESVTAFQAGAAGDRGRTKRSGPARRPPFLSFAIKAFRDRHRWPDLCLVARIPERRWMDASDPRYAAVQALMAYWRAHPQASDTLEGICRWWLNADTSLAPRVEPALRWLVDHGVVQARQASDRRVRYRWAGELPSRLP